MFADRLKSLREQKGLTQKQMLDEIINALSQGESDDEKATISLSTCKSGANEHKKEPPSRAADILSGTLR